MRYWLIVPILTMLLTACGGGAPATEPQQANNQNPPTPTQETQQVAESSPIADSPNPEGVVARVNGVEISQGAFDRAYTRRSANSTAADDTALRLQVVNTLVEQELIEQAATGMGIVVTDADVEAQIVDLQAGVAESDVESWEVWLETNSYTEDELRDELYNNQITQGIFDSIMTNDLTGDVPQVHARHILVETQAEAVTALARIQNGEDFAAVAAEVSVDLMTRDLGGDLGWFIAAELTDPALAQVAFDLEPGQVAGPVQSIVGFHVIQTLEKETRPIEPERLPFLMQTLFEQWLAEQYNIAQIEILIQ